MFTGIIRDLGKVFFSQSDRGFQKIGIQVDFFDGQAAIGDSVAINGACMTVDSFENNNYFFYVSKESLDRTNLGELKIGDVVNLEKSLVVGSRIDGHFVSGHVDDMGGVKSIARDGLNYLITISFPERLSDQIVDKGSVAIDGISLTVIKPNANCFQVTIVPHTLENTTLRELEIGDTVNIETDILAKYVTAGKAKEGLTAEFLSNAGF